jgi:peptidyl-prolyl cis-trans isomerase D
MLNTMRGFASGFVAKLLLLFLVITFGIWGVGDILRSSGTNYAARVGDQTVSLGEFARARAAASRQVEALGLKINPGALDMSILRQLVQQQLINLSLHDLGLYVNNTLLTERLRTEPLFSNKDGSFNAEAFHAIARNQNLSEGAMLQQMKNQISGEFIIASLDMSDITPPTSVRTLMSASALETRDAWVLTISPAAAPATISDEDLQAFYEQNKSVLYVQPESRNFDYVTLTAGELNALIDQSITPQMLADAAKAQPKAPQTTLHDMLRSEQRDTVTHQLQGTIDDTLASGASFADAVKKAGLHGNIHTLNGVTQTIAKTTQEEVARTVAEQGFVLSEGETSGLISTPHGTLVMVHVASIQPSSPQAFDKVKADVRGHVVDEKRREATRNQMQQVRAAITALGGEGKPTPTDAQYQAVFKQFHLAARHVAGLARPTGAKEANGIPASLQQAIFEHQVGNIAGPLMLENGGQMLAVVTATHHPNPQSIKEKSGTLEEKQRKEMADALNQSIQGQAFTAFAKKHPVIFNPKVLAAPAAGDAE